MKCTYSTASILHTNLKTGTKKRRTLLYVMILSLFWQDVKEKSSIFHIFFYNVISLSNNISLFCCACLYSPSAPRSVDNILHLR